MDNYTAAHLRKQTCDIAAANLLEVQQEQLDKLKRKIDKAVENARGGIYFDGYSKTLLDVPIIREFLCENELDVIPGSWFKPPRIVWNDQLSVISYYPPSTPEY